MSISLSGLLHGLGRLVYMIKEEAGWRYISAIMAGHGIPEYTEYIFYCKRAILFLSSSKVLTPHPPLRPASLSSPRNRGGGYTLAGRRGGWGVNILEDERKRIALLQ